MNKSLQEKFQDKTAGEILGWAMGVGLFAVVLGFLGLHSLNAFYFIFKGEQEYLAFLGFGMTGGAMIVYLVKLVNSQKASNLKRVIYFVMLMVCGTGEVLTSLFGMKLGAAESGTYVLPQETVNTFFLLVQGLGFLHFFAIVGELAGEQIAEMFNASSLVAFFTRKQENTRVSEPAQMTALASETDQVEIIHPNGKERETAANFTKGEK